jgi:hypothetical protein
MSDSNKEKRRKERILATDELISVALTPVGTDDEILGFVVDTSAHGFQITVSQEIPPKTTVKISITKQVDGDTWETDTLIARVKWCRQDEFLTDSYNIGVEISDIALVE